MVVVVFGGDGERVVVLTRVGDKEGGGVKAAPLNLFSSWAAFGAATPIITPAMQKQSHEINNLGRKKKAPLLKHKHIVLS